MTRGCSDLDATGYYEAERKRERERARERRRAGSSVFPSESQPHNDRVCLIEQHVKFWMFYMDFLLLMGYVKSSFFLSFFFSIYLINHLTLAGIITASVETLPHVIKYQTVIPLRLKDSSVFNDDDDAVTHKVTLTLLCCWSSSLRKKWSEEWI